MPQTLEIENKNLRINDGSGLFDAAGFCDNLLRILNAQGLELLRDTLKDKREGDDEHDPAA